MVVQHRHGKLDAFLKRILNRSNPMVVGHLFDEAIRLEKFTAGTKYRGRYNLLGQRLQALKRAGKVAYLNKAHGGPGWVAK